MGSWDIIVMTGWMMRGLQDIPVAVAWARCAKFLPSFHRAFLPGPASEFYDNHQRLWKRLRNREKRFSYSLNDTRKA